MSFGTLSPNSASSSRSSASLPASGETHFERIRRVERAVSVIQGRHFYFNRQPSEEDLDDIEARFGILPPNVSEPVASGAMDEDTIPIPHPSPLKSWARQSLPSAPEYVKAPQLTPPPPEYVKAPKLTPSPSRSSISGGNPQNAIVIDDDDDDKSRRMRGVSWQKTVRQNKATPARIVIDLLTPISAFPKSNHPSSASRSIATRPSPNTSTSRFASQSSSSQEASPLHIPPNTSSSQVYLARDVMLLQQWASVEK